MDSSARVIALGEGQLVHATVLIALVAVAAAIWNGAGRPYPAAFWTAIAVPILHQVYVWLTWRVELNSGAVSRSIGFRGYIIVFFILFASRFVSLACLGWLDRGSLGLPPIAQALLTLALLVPGLYAGYSVRRYFGMVRAAGADHFDASYRSKPLVREGIFRYTNNGMYVYAFLLFWALAVAMDSAAALLVAAFSHAYIWVHFFTVERPDMIYLYRGRQQ